MIRLVLWLLVMGTFPSTLAFVVLSPTKGSSTLAAIPSSILRQYIDTPSDEIRSADCRRRFLSTTTAIVAGAFGIPVDRVEAKYGASSNMELPNYIEYLVEKNSEADQRKALYKGADPVVLLRRLQEADSRLKEIPSLAEKKKWSQVQGLLTGPLGTLSQTLNQIATPDSDPNVQKASKKLKSDLIAIGEAASKKSDAACIAKSQAASQDLIKFLEIAFEN